MQLGDMTQAETGCEFMAQETGRMLQSAQRLPLFALGSADSHLNGSVFAIGADMNFDHLDGEQPRVGRFEPDELGEFFADGFGDSECASFIHVAEGWGTQMNADERG